jgi:N-acyl-D-aspartate/D-glutamate deacylase
MWQWFVIMCALPCSLALFSRKTVSDRATYANPHQYPDGIPIVIVNGVPVLRDGKCTGARPGQILALSAGRLASSLPRRTRNLR